MNSGHALQNAEAFTLIYVSTGQDTQGAVPFVSLYLLSAHARQGPPSAPSYPVLHEQFVTSVAARKGSKLFAGHVVHAAVPLVSLYLPGTHATHGPPKGPVYPMLHGHRLVPATEFEFGGHPTHSDEFRQFLDLPASHSSHGPKFGPVDPAAQKQVLSPGIDTVPSGQDKHDDTEVAVVMLWNVFVAHKVHAALPLVALYVPGRQVVHWPFEGPLLAPVYPILHAQISSRPYTSTSGNCTKRAPNIANLRNRAVPSHM